MNQNSKAYNYVVYSVIRQNGGWCNWTMIEIEKYPCNDKRELEKRKREWIEKLNATLNKQLPTRTQQDYMKEYRNQNNDQINAYKRFYYDQNKEKMQEEYVFLRSLRCFGPKICELLILLRVPGGAYFA